MNTTANALPITEDERTWAILAHLSALLSVFTGFILGPVAAFAIWLVKKEQSPYVGFQALQSLVYQLVTAVLNWVMWIMIILLSAILIGCLLVPFGILVSLATVAYPLYAAYRCSQGEDFRYPLIADMLAPRPAPLSAQPSMLTTSAPTAPAPEAPAEPPPQPPAA